MSEGKGYQRRENPPCCIYKRALISVDAGNCLANFAKSINIPFSFNIDITQHFCKEEKILPEATPAFLMSALVRSRLSRMMGTRGAATKVEMQVVKKEIHERSLKFTESSHFNFMNQLLECCSRKCLVEQCMLHYLHLQLLEPLGLEKSHMIREYDVSHFSTIRIPDSLHGWPRSLCDSMKWQSLFALRKAMK
ncbi:hypothetical protein Tco_0979750 [Tanacetum coccineum]